METGEGNLGLEPGQPGGWDCHYYSMEDPLFVMGAGECLQVLGLIPLKEGHLGPHTLP